MISPELVKKAFMSSPGFLQAYEITGNVNWYNFWK